MKERTLKALNKFRPEKNYFIRRVFDFVVVSFLIITFAFTTQSNSSNHNTTAVSAQPYLGEIAIYPYNFAPDGWIKCDGQILQISQNTALFSLIGTIYGGDGETTFGVPDLRGRTIVSYGSGPGLPTVNLGVKSGSPNSLLNVGNLPAHTHVANLNGNITIPTNADPGNLDTDDPDGAFICAQNTDHFASSPTVGAGITVMPTGLTVSVGNTGGNQEFTNMPPFQALGYYISLTGVYPSPF